MRILNRFLLVLYRSYGAYNYCFVVYYKDSAPTEQKYIIATPPINRDFR